MASRRKAGTTVNRLNALFVNRLNALGLDHPAVTAALNRRAWLLSVNFSASPRVLTTLLSCLSLMLQGRYAEAETLYRRCQAILEQALSSEHPRFAATLNSLAALLARQVIAVGM